MFQKRRLSSYLCPLFGPNPHLTVVPLLRVQGTHECPNGCSSNHVHRDAALRQGPDDANLGTASCSSSTKHQGNGIARQYSCQPGEVRVPVWGPLEEPLIQLHLRGESAD